MDKDYAQYLLKKTTQDYNLIAEEFSSKREKPWPELKFLFNDYLIAGERVLDLGCGNGRFFEFCQDRNIDYIGIDASKELIAIAQKRYPKTKFQVADALNLPFPNNYFDKVYNIAVLHQIPSDNLRLQLLREARRVLRPQGLLILTVWRFYRPRQLFLIFKFTILKLLNFSRLDFGDVFVPWDKKTKRYYHAFFKKELINLVRGADFKVKSAGVAKNEKGDRQNIYLVAEKEV
jgi:ubiquinone/menaquinone biosynthesis C-methylase UbiE